MSLHSPAPLPVAALVAAAIAAAAWRGRSLDRTGMVAAFGTGTIALSLSWGWGLFLIVWFVLAALLSRAGRVTKAARTDGVVAKGGRRDWWQVLANGGVYAAGALALHSGGLEDATRSLVAVAATAALVAAGADTWGTELGTLSRARPWSLRERRTVDPGTSGAISALGTAASAAGALLLSVLAVALGVIGTDAYWPTAIGGFGGSVVDTLIGAWLQSRRWCPHCSMATEQPVHRCGTTTVRRGGLALLTNDGVNMLCTASGAAIAILANGMRN